MTHHLLVALSAVALFAVARPSLQAQTTIPVDHEPRHHLKLEAADVRVFDVVVPPGDTTFFHEHAVDYAYITFGSATLRAQPLDGEWSDLLLTDGQVRFTRGPIVHRVGNIGSTPFHNLTVELRSPPRAPPRRLRPLAPGDSVVMENARIRVTRYVIAPGATTIAHEHGGPVLELFVDGGSIEERLDGKSSPTVRRDVGAFEWMGAPHVHGARNVGVAPVRVIEVEWR